MSHLEIALSIISTILFLTLLITQGVRYLERDYIIHYKVLWKQAEQDNKWLRTLLQVEYEAQGKTSKVEGTKLGDDTNE